MELTFSSLIKTLPFVLLAAFGIFVPYVIPAVPKYDLMACNSVTGCTKLGSFTNIKTCMKLADKMSDETELNVIICSKDER